ncbi:MAG: hypothetical protein J6A59_10945 [Lachnospiraceae bacterium]|nr:hypothetical protein [Lachnospiraceae bacterium]
MAKFSKELLDMLTEFMICEVGSKALDGITYTMVLKTARDKELYTRYMTIRNEAAKCGYTSDEVFRVYEVANGYIFDMDLETAKQMTIEIAKSVSKNNGGKTPSGNIIKDMPEQRRKRDLVNLAKYLKSEYDNGRYSVEVALFSRNSMNKIIVTGKGARGETLALRYNAYAIRHWDIEILNEKFLIPAGFRVRSIQPCEILPSKTGVSFIFRMESMEQYEDM